MSNPDSDAEAARVARNSAKVRMEERFSALKGGYEQKGIGSRIGDRVSAKLKDTAQDVVEVASESKGLIAGTAGLLAIWLARRPLTSVSRKLLAKARDRIDKGF